MSEKMATGAAKVFEVVVKEKIVQIFSNLRQTLKRTDLMNTRVSVPLSAVYCFLAVFLCAVANSGIVVFANFKVIHSSEL